MFKRFLFLILLLLLIPSCTTPEDSPKQGEVRVCADTSGQVVEDVRCEPQTVSEIQTSSGSLTPLYIWWFLNRNTKRPLIGSNISHLSGVRKIQPRVKPKPSASPNRNTATPTRSRTTTPPRRSTPVRRTPSRSR